MYKQFLFSVLDQTIRLWEIYLAESKYSQRHLVPQVEQELRALNYIRFIIENEPPQNLAKYLKWFESLEVRREGFNQTIGRQLLPDEKG